MAVHFILNAASTYIPTILVEVYSNEQVNGLQKANNIIEVIKSAVDDNIVKKQTSEVASSASYVVLLLLQYYTIPTLHPSIMHLSMQSPTPPPPPPPPPPPTRGRVGICHRGIAKDAPLGPKFLDNPPLTPYYSPGVYPGKAANNVKLPLYVVY